MDKVSNQNVKLLSVPLVSFILFIGIFFYSSLSQASTNTSPPTGTQLAYFVGYHSYGGHFGPKYRSRGAYWTGWRYIGHGCKRSCLIDRWSGRVIRCNKRC